ncbi:MAG: hypothetical protein ACKOGG_05015, partial [Actinomycetota bacterium]
MQVVVTKHHGLGNDFLVLDTLQFADSKIDPAKIDWPAIAREWCNRDNGVGADGLLLMTRLDEFKLQMKLYNADGSTAEMSGNGIRCLAQAAFDADDGVRVADRKMHHGPIRVGADCRPILGGRNFSDCAHVDAGEHLLWRNRSNIDDAVAVVGGDDITHGRVVIVGVE